MNKHTTESKVNEPNPSAFAVSRRALLKSTVALPALGFGSSTFAEERQHLSAEAPSAWHAYLTETERQHPLAKFWYRFTPIAEDELDALARGPMNPADRLI